ncbi:MAG: radical SAM protein [Methanocellales archaeon]|nr:radical SAM protein [Methanocellales archaeon]
MPVRQMGLDGAGRFDAMNRKRHIFGPVPSRRLGFSLGVDIIPYKTCSFDCVYCQLGRTTNKTIQRRGYVPKQLIISELKDYLVEDRDKVDYITFSGSGEPTLNSKIGEMIGEIKQMTDIPTAVLTNGSLLFEVEVRDGLRNADLVLPSLDAVTQNIFERVNRPHEGLVTEKIIEGLKKFRKEFDNEIWLEVMLVKGINDDMGEVERMADIINKINPDKIQLNTVVRPPSEPLAMPVYANEMRKICRMLGEKAEIITPRARRAMKAYEKDIENRILTLLERRPCTLEDISTVLGINRNEAVKYLEVLEEDRRVAKRIHKNQTYFVVSKDEMRSM